MRKSVGTIEIEASPEKVFAFITSEKIGEVYKGNIDFKRTSAGPVGVGSTMHAIGIGVGGKGVREGEWNVEITEFVENKGVTMRIVGIGKYALNSTNAYTLEPTANGTKVAVSIGYEAPNSFLGKLFDKFRANETLEKQGIRLLENLKKALET